MAKGTLHATATATKKGSVSTRAGSKNGKSSIVGSQESTSTSTASKGSKKAKTAAVSTNKKTAASAPAKPAVSEESADDDDDVVLVERDSKDGGPRHLDLKGRKYDKHYKAVVREALGGMDLLYPDEQDKVETILKLFDLEPEYGPAAGMTRLERWKRAANWGLDPPAEVYDILTTIEGDSKDKYRESLYFGRV